MAEMKRYMAQSRPRQAVQTSPDKAVKTTFVDDYYKNTYTGAALKKLGLKKAEKKSSGW